MDRQRHAADASAGLWKTFKAFDDAGNLKGALDFMLGSALRDDPEGQRQIGWLYSARNDYVAAGSWYLKSVRGGSKESIALCRECAELLWQEGLHNEALALAEAEPLSSLEFFRRFLLTGHRQSGNDDAAMAWAARLAEAGKESDVAYFVAQCIANGTPEAAIPVLETSAASGSPAALQMLGEMHENGVGVLRDDEKAGRYYTESAKHGFLLSKRRLLQAKRTRRGQWYLPLFALGASALVIKGIMLARKNGSDPRLSGLSKK